MTIDKDKLFELAVNSTFYRNPNGFYRIQNCYKKYYMHILDENTGEEHQVAWEDIKPTDVFYVTAEVPVSTL